MSRGERGDGPPRYDPIGLCRDCVHHRLTGNRRGSRFHLCGLSKEDPRYPRYPVLPVRHCDGYLLGPPDPWADLDGP